MKNISNLFKEILILNYWYSFKFSYKFRFGSLKYPNWIIQLRKVNKYLGKDLPQTPYTRHPILANAQNDA